MTMKPHMNRKALAAALSLLALSSCSPAKLQQVSATLNQMQQSNNQYAASHQMASQQADDSYVTQHLQGPATYNCQSTQLTGMTQTNCQRLQ